MTRIRIRKGIAKGVIKIPSSKSYGHRALIAAALAHGQSIISNLNYSKDILATIDALRVLGAQIDIEGSRAIVNGCNPFLAKCSNVLCEESGSTLRFLIPVFSLGNELHTFMGKGELLKRPQSVYQKLFNEMDAVFLHYCDRIEAAGPLVAGEYHLAGNVSSQFITGLLFAMPLLNGDSILHIEEPFASKSYVSITIDILRRFNIKITMDGNDIFIKGKQKYLPYDYEVEGDYSSAAFFGLLGAINNEISIKGLSPSLQGDRVVFDYLKLLGAHVDIRENEIVVGSGTCNGCTFDLNDCPDLGPALMALAATKSLYEAGHLDEALEIAGDLFIEDEQYEEERKDLVRSIRLDLIQNEAGCIDYADLPDIEDDGTEHGSEWLFMIRILVTILVIRNLYVCNGWFTLGADIAVFYLLMEGELKNDL